MITAGRSAPAAAVGSGGVRSVSTAWAVGVVAAGDGGADGRTFSSQANAAVLTSNASTVGPTRIGKESSAPRTVATARMPRVQVAALMSSAARRDQVPTSPATTAIRAIVASMPPISTFLSLTPKLSMAQCRTPSGAVSIAQVPTA